MPFDEPKDDREGGGDDHDIKVAAMVKMLMDFLTHTAEGSDVCAKCVFEELVGIYLVGRAACLLEDDGAEAAIADLFDLVKMVARDAGVGDVEVMGMGQRTEH